MTSEGSAATPQSVDEAIDEVLAVFDYEHLGEGVSIKSQADLMANATARGDGLRDRLLTALTTLAAHRG